MKEDLRIIYQMEMPYGIRNKAGFLFFFTSVTKYTGQDERFTRETKELNDMADYLLESLKNQEV